MIPTGTTEFQFKVADFNFHSDSYEWLVVAGASAKFKGVGTINGQGEYKFMLTAVDADVNANDAFDVDRFRIHFTLSPDGLDNFNIDNEMNIYAWDKAVYINNPAIALNAIKVKESIFSIFIRFLFLF